MYAWWAPPDEFALTVVLSPYHVTVEPGAEFEAVLRGYAGSQQPSWEHELGAFRHGDELAVELDSLDVPPPPAHGGVLEVHVVRRDRVPARNVDILGMWVHAEGRDGGGYVIPTIPIRGQRKVVSRDSVQVCPGVVSSREAETDVVLLNPIDAATRAQLTVSSTEGLVLESEWFEIAPWSAWRSALSDALPRVRQLLREADGVGSLTVSSTHKILPYFGMRKSGQPLTAMDHAAPIFA